MSEQDECANCIILKTSILAIQICSALSEDETLKWVREASPAGTSNNWCKSDDPGHASVNCADGGGRKHYVFIC